MGHRYYDPSTGRFLTRDPIQDGRNYYAYVGGRGAPIGFADPDGLSPGDIIGAIGVGYSWWEFSQDPNPATFGWAMLDTVTEAVPIIPGTSIRHGGKVLKVVGNAKSADEAAERIIGEARKKAVAPPARPGTAPIGNDGNPLELHHPGQKPDSSKVEVLTREEYR